MSRVYCVTSLALGMVLCLTLTNRANAQFGGGGGGGGQAQQQREHERKDSTTIAISEAEKRIDKVLDEELKEPLQFEDQPLDEIINLLQEAYDIPIVFDIAALDEVAISPDTEITCNLRHISLRSALNLILQQPGLEDTTFIVYEEVLLITSEEKANSNLVVQVYRVDDLVNNYSQAWGGDQKNPYSSLIQVITSCVEFDSWMANGKGKGEIKLIQPGMLVVSQPRHVQGQVRELLGKLRETQAEIEGE